MGGGDHDQVNGNAEIAERLAESYELGAATLQLRLDDEQVQVAVGASLASGAGAEQDHLGVGRGCRKTAASLSD